MRVAVALLVLASGLAKKAPVHVYNLPGTPECADSADQACDMVVRMCATDESECEIQCRSSQPPKLDESCLRTHPCATDVESFCSDMPPGSVMKCLKSHRAELSQGCQQSDACLGSDDVQCPEVHHASDGVMPMNLIAHIAPLLSSLSRPGRMRVFPPASNPMPFLFPGAPIEQRKEEAGKCRCALGEGQSEAQLTRDDDGGDDDADGDNVADAPGGLVTTPEQVNAAVVTPLGVLGCGEHLQHPLCLPCGDGCVRNPFCGAGLDWCRIQGGGSDCAVSDKVALNPPGCAGPYPDHPQCEEAIAKDLAAHTTPPSASLAVVKPPDSSEAGSTSSGNDGAVTEQERVRKLQARCDAQERQSNAGLCPRPNPEQLRSAARPPAEQDVVYARRCNAAPVHSFADFVSRFMGQLAPEVKEAEKELLGGEADGSASGTGSNAAAAAAAAAARDADDDDGGLEKAASRARNHSLAMLLAPPSEMHKVKGAKEILATHDSSASTTTPPTSPPPRQQDADVGDEEQQRARQVAATAVSGPVTPPEAAGIAHPNKLAGTAGGRAVGGGGVAVPREGLKASTDVLYSSTEGEGGWWGWLAGWFKGAAWLNWLVLAGVLGAAVWVVRQRMAWDSRGGGQGRSRRTGRRGHRLPGSGAFGGSLGTDGDDDDGSGGGVFGGSNDAGGPHATTLFEAFESDASPVSDGARFRG